MGAHGKTTAGKEHTVEMSGDGNRGERGDEERVQGMEKKAMKNDFVPRNFAHR